MTQNFETRVTHAAIVGTGDGKNGGVDGGGESDVLAVLRVAFISGGAVVGGVMFAGGGGVGGRAFRRER